MGFGFDSEQKKTALWILIIIVAISLWDVFLLRSGGGRVTISHIFLMLGTCPTVPLAFGIIAGHVFWPKRGLRPDSQSATNITVLLTSVIGSYLWYTFSFGPVMRFLSDNPMLVFVAIGMPLGHFLWSQYSKEI